MGMGLYNTKDYSGDAQAGLQSAGQSYGSMINAKNQEAANAPAEKTVGGGIMAAGGGAASGAMVGGQIGAAGGPIGAGVGALIGGGMGALGYALG